MGLDIIREISHKYGSNPNYVLAGGGNTSYKDEHFLYIKGSGTSLATIENNGFVKMSRKSLDKIWEKTYLKEQDKREAEVLADMMGAKCKGEEAKRPSVETLLHNLFIQPYVLHVHPTMVNGLTCSNGGKDTMEKMFPNAIWVEETEPGYTLAVKCRERIGEYEKRTNTRANLLFLQNHGVFFAADNAMQMDILVDEVMDKFKKSITTLPDLQKIDFDVNKIEKIASKIKECYEKDVYVKFTINKEVERLCSSYVSFEILTRPMSPDHIVYCKAVPMFLESIDNITGQYKKFVNENKYEPKIIFIKNIGMFAIGKSEKDSLVVSDVWMDAVKISVYAQNFGGVRHMAPDMVDFIANWEVESYRSKVNLNQKGLKYEKNSKLYCKSR